ncbi:Fe-S cluster assembly sulfur transfer protein SufU [Cellulomonas gilvus]|uniref:SUF system FeS assembly protein, NifU family n=1 Tax=Cellulomonas gilvus (strain ATCC 13127 / NRRL B-14078) TaxID=593907 RepID=F8A7L8_CELGA|nr:SUF system NifU family Fe-S cluster assembly protein [Cellulomonas gilvus]AEI12420.1 SUF system FeS assembly protein, NifU family [Cellulomonas gilvus ATCC 13127]
MTSSMEQLYQQVILDHAKHPHGRGLGGAAEGARTGESHQVNPTCGDEVTLQVDVDDAGVVRGLRWEGQGCSISQASVSVLHDLVLDQPLPTVDGLAGSFRALMQSRGAGLDDDDEQEALGDAAAFTGVGKYSARVKCALLGWVALNDALIKTGSREDA